MCLFSGAEVILGEKKNTVLIFRMSAPTTHSPFVWNTSHGGNLWVEAVDCRTFVRNMTYFLFPSPPHPEIDRLATSGNGVMTAVAINAWIAGAAQYVRECLAPYLLVMQTVYVLTAAGVWNESVTCTSLVRHLYVTLMSHVCRGMSPVRKPLTAVIHAERRSDR